MNLIAVHTPMLLLLLLLLQCFLSLTECQIVGEGALRFFRNGEVDDSTAINFNSGIVQILTEEGIWGNICIMSGFSKTEADVICRQLGYAGASSSTPFRAAFEPSSGISPTTPLGIDGQPTVIRDLSCNSTSISVTQCSYNGITGMDFDCQDNNNDVIVTCDPDAVVVSERKGNVRLRDGLYSNDGLLEVYCGSQWGTVCIEGFSDIAALLACGQLGYNSYKTFFTDTMNMTSLNVPIWYDSEISLLGCTLPIDETMEYCLTKCNFCRDIYSMTNSTCTHSDDVILVCNYNTSRPVVGSTNTTIEECAALNSPQSSIVEVITITSSYNTILMTPLSSSQTGTSTISVPMTSLNSQTTTSASNSVPLSTPASSSLPAGSNTISPQQAVLSSATIGAIAGSIGGSLIIIVLIICLFVFVMYRKKGRSSSSKIINSNNSSEDHLPTTRQNEYFKPTSIMMEKLQDDKPQDVEVSVILSSSMIKPTDLKVIEKIGQGEFGVVYRGLLTTYEGRETKVISVAAKTLKGNYSKTQIDELIVEAEKMIQFDHFNVLSLYGVCVGLLESPCIVMPFMSNGSLLSYLRKESADLTISESSDESLRLDMTKQLLSMCLQVAKGMTYLTEHKFVHRDLAARNCMISADGVIKVADFGLAEDVYTTEYFKQDRSSEESVKLPLKWMALESIHYGKFSEKSDVWSFGVLCWEVFSVGKSPYPGMSPLEVVEMLDSGRRLSRPSNAACCDKSYGLILSCWEQSPDKRPRFFELVQRIEQLLGPLADYVDFSSNFARKLST